MPFLLRCLFGVALIFPELATAGAGSSPFARFDATYSDFPYLPADEKMLVLVKRNL